jgi:hypothetical protein
VLAGGADSSLPDEERVPQSSLDNAAPQRAWDPITTIARLGEARAA